MSFDGLLSLRRREPQVEIEEPTLGQELTEVARETFEYNPVQAIQRQEDLAAARRFGNLISAQQARAQLTSLKLENQVTVPNQGITQEALDILIQRANLDNKRQDIFSRSPGGIGRTAARFAVGLGVSFFDPANAVAGLIPIVGTSRYMALLRARQSLLGRTGVRFGVGAVEGAVGAAIVEPIILSAAQAEQADYDLYDSMLNIAFGGLLGGGLHTVVGAGYEAFRQYRGLDALPPREQIDAAVQQAIIDADEVLPKPVDVPEPVRVPVAEKFKPTTIKPIDAYIESAKQISQELRRTLDIDINDAKAVSKATGEKAVSIAEFVKRTGGIVDDGGELSARDVTNKRYPGLVRKDTPENRQMAGMDSVRERLYDAGYFPDRTSYNDISDSEIFDALAEDLSGTRIWSGAVREKLSKFLGNKEYITQMEMEGFSRDMSVTQIADRLRMMDDAARAEVDRPASIEPDALLEYERIAAELNAQASAANVIDSVNPETRRAALTTGVAQAIDAREINVESIVSLDPSLARGGEDFSLNSARNAAIENFRPDQRTMVDFEAAAETPQPKREPMLDSAQAALDDAMRAADEATSAVNRDTGVIPSRLVQEEAVQYIKAKIDVIKYANTESARLRKIESQDIYEKNDSLVNEDEFILENPKFVDEDGNLTDEGFRAFNKAKSDEADRLAEFKYPKINTISDLQSASEDVRASALKFISDEYARIQTPQIFNAAKLFGLDPSPPIGKNHYINITDPNTDETLNFRLFKDHKQVKGGGYDPQIGERVGESDVDVWIDENGKIHVDAIKSTNLLNKFIDQLKKIDGINVFSEEIVLEPARLIEENPAIYTADEGLQRYIAEGPVASQAGPRALAAQRAAVKAVDDLRSSGDVLGLALSRDFAARQKVSLVGQKIASTEDFATLAQVYRDPRFETLRYVFVDNNGNVVGQAGVTSRLPGSALAFAGPDATDFFSELGSRARQLGAKQVYLLHNHPSGIARPSQADIRFTEKIAEYFKDRGIKFADHVVIDTNEYSVIKANGEVETIQKDFGQPSLARLKGMVDRPIKRPEVLASIAREIQFDDKAVVLVVTNNQFVVQNIAEVPFDKVMSYGNTPEGKRRALFALRRLTLSSDGAFIFAISKNEEALLPFKNVTADQIVIDQRGFGRQAWPEQPLGRVLPAERRGRISPETGPEFDYLRGMSTSDTMRQIGVREEGAAYNAGDPNTEMRPFREAIERADLYAQAVRAAADRLGNDDAARSAMQAATRGELGASEIDILLDRLKQENTRVRSRLKQAREVFTAEDKIDTLEGDAMKAADSLANNIKLDATIAARNAALSLAARTKAAGRILTQFRDNPSEGLLSILGGSSFARFGSKDSAFHWQRTYFTRWTKGMLADLERDGLAEAFTSNAYGRDVARALYQLGRAEPRLEGLDDNAVKIAKIVYKYREDSRNTRNRFGAWIRDLTGYITRQQHDFMKIRAAGSKAWKDFVRQRLDIDRSLQPGQNLEEFLDTVYADLAAGRHLSAIDEEAQAYTTPGSLARRASQSRVIYFKDADAEFDYLTEFGVGKLHEAILGDLSRAAQQAGLMRVLGPNPQFTLKAVTSEVEAGLVRDPEMRQKFAESKDTAESLLSMLDGRANVPGNAMSARVGSNVRVVQAMSKLGGAVISAVTDLPVYASQIKYQGRGGLLTGIGEGISGLLQGRAKGERKRILNMIDTVADNLVGGVATRFDSDDLMSAGSADLMRIFFRLNGLQWWTDTLRESMELGTANWMGNIRNTSYDRLGADTKRLFEQYGITSAEWDVMRQATVDAADKRVYVVPEQVTKLDLDIFKNYLSAIGREPTDEAAAIARRDMADRMRNFIIDQAMTAVIEPDVRSRYFWTRGLRPGTFWGETARYIAQFKGFPTALTRQVFGREIYGRGYNSLTDYLKYGKADMLGLAQLILMMTAFGYAAMAAKDLLKGKTPRDPANPQTWLAAMLQGGALGIYGDFLLGQSNRFGRNIIDTLAGPTFGLIGDLDELRQRAMRGDDVAASAFRTIISNTPFMNLFYARIVLDYLVLYQIQEALNPGYLRRMERRIEREQGQEFLLAPSEVAQ